MKRLKLLRESAKLSQKALADRLRTTQQTVARWESGKAEPNISTLRDLALIFGTSVDDILLGRGLDARKVPSTTHYILAGEDQDGFSGHIGLKMTGQGLSKWFPVTISEASRIRSELSSIEDDEAWLLFTTLANKLVIFRPSTMQKICLLDDACDQPEGDWQLDLPYQGLPLEIYRSFERLNNSEADWEAAASALPVQDDDELGNSIDEEGLKNSFVDWEAFLQTLYPEFGGEASDEFIDAAAQAFIEQRFEDEEDYYNKMHHTSLHFVDGHTERFWVEEKCLATFMMDVEMGSTSKMINLEEFGGDADNWYSSSQLCAVVMPLIDVIDAMQEIDE